MLGRNKVRSCYIFLAQDDFRMRRAAFCYTRRVHRCAIESVGRHFHPPSYRSTCIFLSLSRPVFPLSGRVLLEEEEEEEPLLIYTAQGSPLVRRIVTACVRSTRSADISTLSEADLPYFSKSLAN